MGSLLGGDLRYGKALMKKVIAQWGWFV